MIISPNILDNETSHEVILRLKSIFVRHGITQEVFAANGLQYSSMEFSDFAKGLSIQPAAQNFPRTMGKQGELSIVSKLYHRRLMTLGYRSTPVCCRYSPAELLMNMQLCFTVLITPTQLQPAIPDYSKLKEREETMREKQTDNFNTRHRSRELTPLFPGETVWVTDQQTPTSVVVIAEIISD